jgi:hypothetical protein
MLLGLVFLMATALRAQNSRLAVQPGSMMIVTGGALVLNNTDLLTDGAFDASAATVWITGSNNTFLGGTVTPVIQVLELNTSSASTLSLNGNVQVSSVLDFLAGLIDLNSNQLHLTGNAILQSESETSHLTGLSGGTVTTTAAGVSNPFQLNIGNLGAALTTATINSTNASTTNNALDVTTVSQGVIADHSMGNAGNFFNNNTGGVGAGVRGEVNSIFGNNGTAGVYGVSSGTGGYAGYFDHTETTGFGISVEITTHDLGIGLLVDHEGSSGDLAVFQTGGGNVARISRTGTGYFDDGTQNSGADLAEAFDVEGDSRNYEPGDVLLISTEADRTVVRSNAPYSTLVAGVYATKPGVLLTEESVDSPLTGKVPMGVVGVIPTKVCDEGGVIHRGDILVTSSRTGYAMKADLHRLQAGQAIGKALEEFSGTTGKIKVLVNVK